MLIFITHRIGVADQHLFYRGWRQNTGEGKQTSSIPKDGGGARRGSNVTVIPSIPLYQKIIFCVKDNLINRRLMGIYTMQQL